ncbi:MAG: ABC transporter substrate-binding protein [Corynebacterium sp.]|uniref:ABC transporter substrate-binding protein n=1 Tax=Corynebacterium sp. TaxID=1720 RepID=UPI0026DB71B8|nr:ABC transporter substrate-binding protein [Corynebacterium sp.]MDO5029889.1 ABC transporter substrate-binding protein [Corynebacterium sp.]
MSQHQRQSRLQQSQQNPRHSRRAFIHAVARVGAVGAAGAVLATLTGTVAGCAPSATNSQREGKEIRIGSAMFPESEIIARIWAYALQDAGVAATVVPQIGSREVYLEALTEGSVDIVPEYSGNLGSYYGDVPVGADAAGVMKAVRTNLPPEFFIAATAPAESKDAYRITRKTSEDLGVTSLEDLNRLLAKTQRIRIGGSPELAERPYGPKGLTKFYGLPADRLELVGYGDSGGPLTIRALVDGAVDVANIFTTTPLLDSSGQHVELVTLDDPKRMISAQNVVALARRDSVPEAAARILTQVSKNLTTADLVAMNERASGAEKASAGLIARDWLKGNTL